MSEHVPPPDWLDRANRLATIAWLLSTTVHDANNVLQVISGNAEMLEDAAVGNEALLKRSRSIGTNARRASTLLSELLDFARDDPPEPALVDLRRLAERSLGLRLYALKKLRIAAAVEGEAGVMVRARPRDVVQIVVNLIVNAERALGDREDGRVTLTVGGTGTHGTVVIEDNGPGMPADRVGDVFEPRIDEAGRPGIGLGIGLNVARRLAGQHGGGLTYAPGPGGGCAFRLSLTRG